MTTPDWSLRTVPADLRARYREQGLWTDDTFGTFLHGAAAARPADEVRVWSSTRPQRSTLAEVGRDARAVAAGLAAHGIRPGDVVSYQMPNRIETIVTFWALAMLGAVIVPVVHFYGPKELGYVLRRSRARAHVTTASWGHLDYLAGLETLRDDLTDLETVVVVGDGPRPADTVSFSALAGFDPIDAPAAVDPDAPAVVAYTSGTTSDPKGVVHSHRTLLAEVRQLSGIQEPGTRPLLIGAPLAHAIGLLGGLLSPLQRRQPVHVADGWDPGLVLDAMIEADLSAGSGATYFFTSLLDHPRFTAEHARKMGLIGLGGSPVPAAVGDRARELGIKVSRSYGSTELPSTTGSGPRDSHEQRCHTDGVPLPGVEVRVVDAEHVDLPRGVAGHLLARGPELFLGYTDPALTAAAVDADGWYATGDIGVADERGAITITDRLKDVIIRGGENISAAEVEEILVRMPGVAEVAVVAAPDARLGEHACAFVRPAPGASAPDLDAIRRHLEEAGLARQKWPEEVRGTDEMPRTPSGKIKKFALREQLRREAAAVTDRGAGPGAAPR